MHDSDFGMPPGRFAQFGDGTIQVAVVEQRAAQVEAGGERLDGVFRRAICAHHGDRHASEHGTDVHDAARSGFQHGGQYAVREVLKAEHVHLELAADRIPPEVFQRAGLSARPSSSQASCAGPSICASGRATSAQGGFTPPHAVQLALVHGGSKGELHLPVQTLERRVRRAAASRGLHEAVTWSFLPEKEAARPSRGTRFRQGGAVW